MNEIIITKTYIEPSFCEKEILRYVGCKTLNDEVLQLLHACLEAVRDKLSYRVCYRNLSVVVRDSICDFGDFHVESKHLARHLEGCQNVILFAATIGVEMDRLLARYGRISPAKALMLQAIGTERIEALCDVFCEDVAKEQHTEVTSRFSPGYGDLSLDTQKEFFRLLDCSKKIGLSLNDSLLMSPSKSVTAFIGLKEKPMEEKKANKCAACTKIDCDYRGVL